jgi:mRNA-degrading endonuclease RelE of RelBE toxin-antitoxin system
MKHHAKGPSMLIPGKSTTESRRFRKEKDSLPKHRLSDCHEAIEQLICHPDSRGLNLEKLERWGNVYTIKVDQNYRISMRRIVGGWELLRIANHNEIYRNPGV